MVRFGHIGFFLDDPQLRLLLGEEKGEYRDFAHLRAQVMNMALVFMQVSQSSTDFLIGRNIWRTVNCIPPDDIAELNERLASFSFHHDLIQGRMGGRVMRRWFARVHHSDLVMLKLLDARL